MFIKKVRVVNSFSLAPADMVGYGVIRGVDEVEGQVYTIKHTSPYYGVGGGILSLPTENSMILICGVQSSIEGLVWYYMATITSPQVSFANEAKKSPDGGSPFSSPLASIYGDLNPVPNKVAIQSELGNRIELSDDYSDKKNNIGIFLKTPRGKLVKLSDDPLHDCILIKTGDGEADQMASISLTEKQKPGSTFPAYSINIICNNNMDITSKKGTINMTVIDGSEINITNTSTGVAAMGPLDQTPGNINITSDRGDINITAGPTLLQQLASEAQNQIPGQAPELPITPAINIKAMGGPLASLNLDSDGIVNINGRLGVNITSETFGVPSGPVLVNGVTIDLNP